MSIFYKRRRPEAQPSLRLKITIVVEPDQGEFHAYCPAFQGLHVDGGSVEEAVKHAQDAVILHLESLARHGDPLPVGPDCIVEHEEQFRVPVGAFLRHLELQWPSRQMSGTR